MSRKFVIVDLECTCWERNPPSRKETIEIGSVAFQKSRGVLSEFATFVKPQKQPVLSEFCRSLTSIEQSDVDDAPLFNEAFLAWTEWSSQYEPFVFASWGAFDLKQLRADCKANDTRIQVKDFLNLKDAFAALTDGKRRGMAGALQLAELELAGTHHRGIDDARNIARLLGWLLEKDPSGLSARIEEPGARKRAEKERRRR